MSIIRITEGEHITNIEGSWSVYTDTFEASAGQFSHFTAKEGTHLGDPLEAPKTSDNAFIPIITPINDENDIFKSYEIIVNNNREWKFSSLIEDNYRVQKSHEVKFKNNNGARVAFKVKKGNPNANDSDGGNITIFYFKTGKEKSIQSTIQNDINYGDIIHVDWDATKGITQIQFYADDNDFYFDGDVKNVFCGAAKIFKHDCPVCGEWETIPSIIPIDKYEGYRTDCHIATNKQLDVMGYREGLPRYQIAKAIRDRNKKFVRMEYFKDEYVKGANYIKEALKNGIPITVGVDNHKEITPGNPDLTTDHFVVIVGMGTDEKGNYFHFFDNADYLTGTSIKNKLYCVCKENKLEGETDANSTYGRGLTYTITSIRTSIKK